MVNCIYCGSLGPRVRVSLKRDRISNTYAGEVLYLQRNSVEHIHFFHFSREVLVETTSSDQRLFIPVVAQASSRVYIAMLSDAVVMMVELYIQASVSFILAVFCRICFGQMHKHF